MGGSRYRSGSLLVPGGRSTGMCSYACFWTRPACGAGHATPPTKNWPLPIATDGCRSSRIAAVRLPPGTIGSERLESVGQGLILDLRRGVGPDGLAGAQLHVDGHPRWSAPAPTGRQRPCRRHGHRSPQSRRLRTGLAGARAPFEGRTRASTRCGCFGSSRRGYAHEAFAGLEPHQQTESFRPRPQFKPVSGSASQPTTSATSLLQNANNNITINNCN